MARDNPKLSENLKTAGPLSRRSSDALLQLARLLARAAANDANKTSVPAASRSGGEP